MGVSHLGSISGLLQTSPGDALPGGMGPQKPVTGAISLVFLPPGSTLGELVGGYVK